MTILFYFSVHPVSFGSGVFAGSECHHAQFAAGTSVVESHHTQMGSLAWTQNSHLTIRFPEELVQAATSQEEEVLLGHSKRLLC